MSSDNSIEPSSVKSEINSFGTIKNEQMDVGSRGSGMLLDTSKDFLFDPYAAAYYSRFSDYLPGKHCLNEFLAS